jgi:hypothetical protein
MFDLDGVKTNIDILFLPLPISTRLFIFNPIHMPPNRKYDKRMKQEFENYGFCHETSETVAFQLLRLFVCGFFEGVNSC